MVWNIRAIWILTYSNWLIIVFHHHCYNCNLIKKFIPIIYIMLYIWKIDNYLKILTKDKVKDFLVINFGKYFKSTSENLCSKTCEEENLRIVAESLYIFRTTSDELEKYAKMTQSSSSDNYVHHCNIETLNCNWLTLNLWLKTN